MKKRIILSLLMVLHGCVPAAQNAVTRAMPIAHSSLPPLKTFASGNHAGPVRSNRDLALDFMDLSFKLESGRDLPVLTRFEGPISVRITGAPPPTLQADLTRLLSRLRNEAGLTIEQRQDAPASITIEAVARNEIRRMLPQAACFVAPNVSSLAEYRAERRHPTTDWTLLHDRTRVAIFLPNDVSPQEARDCLHEELAQAIGPLNDLYRLPDSVFNDDNVHAVLTGFDMLMLRTYYAPELQSGMTKGQVAAALPAILARLNPAGENRAGSFVTGTPQAWKDAIARALGSSSGDAARRRGAQDALRIAKTLGWTDQRRAFAHFAFARVMQAEDPDTARMHYLEADRYYRATPGAELHRAYVATQLAAHALRADDADAALRIIGPHLASAEAAENAALLSTLLLLKAEALDLQGRAVEARAVRVDSLGWARYGFGPDWAVRAKLREIASLNPRNG